MAITMGLYVYVDMLVCVNVYISVLLYGQRMRGSYDEEEGELVYAVCVAVG